MTTLIPSARYLAGTCGPDCQASQVPAGGNITAVINGAQSRFLAPQRAGRRR
jgi:hypothetical protein